MYVLISLWIWGYKLKTAKCTQDAPVGLLSLCYIIVILIFSLVHGAGSTSEKLRYSEKIARGLNDIYPLLKLEVWLGEAVLSCNTNM